jgi:hypothetical protein
VAGLSSIAAWAKRGPLSMDKKYGVKISAIANQIRAL